MLNIGYTVHMVDEWLDTCTSETYLSNGMAQDWARIAKMGEEFGEVVDAFIGATGQNPRKGVYAGMVKVMDECADTALTAILAIQHFTKDADVTEAYIQGALDRALSRAVRAQEAASGQG